MLRIPTWIYIALLLSNIALIGAVVHAQWRVTWTEAPFEPCGGNQFSVCSMGPFGLDRGQDI